MIIRNFVQRLRQHNPKKPTITEDDLQEIEYEVAEFINFPPIQTFEYEPAKIVEILERFEFETAKIDNSARIQRTRETNWRYTEPLDETIRLEMVSIPGGSFMMGAPENESESHDNERPQHEVTLQLFYMGRYPITQSQWRIVADWPQINRKLNPSPSDFKGDNRPVERVSWEEAIEFCLRLSEKTGKYYRLPSEAEWEYACRAGTTTPFHFGDIITTKVANFNGDYTYNSSPKGVNRRETTNVGIFPANYWGLHDLHGNVWEWCEDDWSSNYENAPTDGIVVKDQNSRTKLLRGSSWFDYPRNCRSACRDFNTRHYRSYNIGLRVCCELPRTNS